MKLSFPASDQWVGSLLLWVGLIDSHAWHGRAFFLFSSLCQVRDSLNERRIFHDSWMGKDEMSVLLTPGLSRLREGSE